VVIPELGLTEDLTEVLVETFGLVDFDILVELFLDEVFFFCGGTIYEIYRENK
jgi:hypothetical protein